MQIRIDALLSVGETRISEHGTQARRSGECSRRLGCLAVGEECVEDHDGASIHEAHLVLEGAAKDVNDVPLARKLLT